jgi:hypothetical protein
MKKRFLAALIFSVCFSVSLQAVPPVVDPVTVTISGPVQETSIQLVASDDGLPGPLSCIITSLPGQGTLVDPGFGEIAVVPYTLQNTEHSVLYQPCFYARDVDIFTYIANDGGTSPDDGDSNTADVTIAFNRDSSVHETATYVERYPFYTSWNDFRMQLIYLAEDFGDAKEITGMSFKIQTAPAPMSNFTIRLRHTDLSEYPADPNFINTGHTMVYRGDFTFPGNGWQQVTFQTPFIYDGQHNILVDISFDNVGFANYGWTYTFSAANRSIYQISRNNHGDPLLWTSSMFSGFFKPSTLPILKLHGQTATAPVYADFNTDCQVGLEDLIAIAGAWLSQNGDDLYVDRFDIASPADQTVNLSDFAVLASEWLLIPPVTEIMAE